MLQPVALQAYKLMEHDRTRSKRPPREDVSESDVPKIMGNMHLIGENIADCQELAFKLGLDKQYDEVAAVGLARFIDLFEKDCEVPMDEKHLSFHAEMRGRMSERLRFTVERQSVKTHIKKLEAKKSLLDKLLDKVKERGKK